MRHARDIVMRPEPRARQAARALRWASMRVDDAMGDRAVQDLADQHAAHLDVGSKGRLALRQLDAVHLRLSRADILSLGGRRNDQGGQRTRVCVAGAGDESLVTGSSSGNGFSGKTHASSSAIRFPSLVFGPPSSPRILAAARSTASTGLT